MSICGYLNESVSHEDQAQKLVITVQLYEELIAARKLYSDKTDASRLALAVSVSPWKHFKYS